MESSIVNENDPSSPESVAPMGPPACITIAPDKGELPSVTMPVTTKEEGIPPVEAVVDATTEAFVVDAFEATSSAPEAPPAPLFTSSLVPHAPMMPPRTASAAMARASGFPSTAGK